MARGRHRGGKGRRKHPQRLKSASPSKKRTNHFHSPSSNPSITYNKKKSPVTEVFTGGDPTQRDDIDWN